MVLGPVITKVFFLLAGFRVSHRAMAALIFRFSDETQNIDLDNFLICMAKLMKVFSEWLV